jgi:hypothetical protein
MSILAAFPLAELAAGVLGTLVAGSSILDLARSRTRAKRIARKLKRSEVWIKFQNSDLQTFLKDNALDDTEWNSIFTVVEGISYQTDFNDDEEFKNFRNTTSSKTKKLLLSGALLDAQLKLDRTG